jgi:N-acetylglucosamine-6-phosphate deacetylase
MNAIVGGKIILKDGILEGCALLYSDVIEGIVPESQVPQDAAVIDAKGGYVAPGLIDLHIHGYLGKDVCDGEEASIRTMAKGLLANGVTGFLPTTMTVDMAVIQKALEVLRVLKEESRNWDGSAILGCHAEGPFISAAKKAQSIRTNARRESEARLRFDNAVRSFDHHERNVRGNGDSAAVTAAGDHNEVILRYFRACQQLASVRAVKEALINVRRHDRSRTCA